MWDCTIGNLGVVMDGCLRFGVWGDWRVMDVGGVVEGYLADQGERREG